MMQVMDVMVDALHQTFTITFDITIAFKTHQIRRVWSSDQPYTLGPAVYQPS